MNVEILRRKNLGNGWLLYEGDVMGRKIGIRIPASYVDSVDDSVSDAEVKQSLQEEYERQQHG